MSEKTYSVHRSMIGPDGHEYAAGDTRVLAETDAADLVASGALALVGEEPKTRDPAVQHTFGQAEATGHVETTTATSDTKMISLKRTGSVTRAQSVEPVPAATPSSAA